MIRTKRKALLATVLVLAAAAAAVPMVVSGTASAQENARLCGRYWRSVDRGGVPGTGEVVTRLYEVTKGTGTSLLSTCTAGNRTEEFPKGFPGTLKEQGKSVREWETNDFSMEICEGWKTRDTKLGGLGGQDLNFIGDNFPANHDQADICNNMNRNETIIDENVYWLYDDNDAATPGVDFQRSR